MSCFGICRGLEINVDAIEEEAALYVKYGFVQVEQVEGLLH